MLSGHSKALYSTWVYYKPDHLLIDCGEGVATSLGNGGFAIERVLLTHGHIDHIAGLPPLLWSRASGMGDTQKPLTIYHPQDDVFVADMQAYLERTRARLPFDLQWVPLDAGDSFPLRESDERNSGASNARRADSRHARRVVTFATRHIRDRLTLGYKITETRRRLKPEYADLSQNEIRERARMLAQSGARGGERDAARSMSEEYEATLVAFGGDGLPLDPEDVRGCELLLHEATILDAAERKHQLHSTLDEAMAVAAAVQPKAFVLYHVSGRYRSADIRRAAQDSMARHGVAFPVWCLFRDRLWRVEGQGGKQRGDRSGGDGPDGES